MEKRKLDIAVEDLSEVSPTFLETKNFINEKLEEKCAIYSGSICLRS